MVSGMSRGTSTTGQLAAVRDHQSAGGRLSLSSAEALAEVAECSRAGQRSAASRLPDSLQLRIVGFGVVVSSELEEEDEKKSWRKSWRRRRCAAEPGLGFGGNAGARRGARRAPDQACASAARRPTACAPQARRTPGEAAEVGARHRGRRGGEEETRRGRVVPAGWCRPRRRP